jgi:hypothetical protein
MISGPCGTVGMNKYWNYVATPLLFTVISFGMYTLFTVDNIQIVGKDHIRRAVSYIKESATPAKSTSGASPLNTVAAPAAPAAPRSASPPAARAPARRK